MKLALALLLCGVAGAGCSLLSSGGAADKAGGHGRAVTLRLAYPDGPGNAPAHAADYFARRVLELSGGRMRVRILWQAGGYQSKRWELRVVQMVRSGRAELALVAARAWAQRGATRLDPLVAPFLLTSDALVRRVAAGPLTRELLSGLGPAGAVGLALIPGGLRHPFSFGQPLLRPADFAGTTIRAPYSDLVYATLRSLGARPVDVEGGRVDAAVSRHQVAAAESGYEFASGIPSPAVATGNVTPFARIDVLAAARGAFAALSPGDRALLRRAAADATRNALRTGRADAQLARQFCASRRGRVVLAAPHDVRALAAAAAPVTARLARDPRTRRAIAEIRSWPPRPRPPVACKAAPAAAPRPARGAADLHALDGVYRIAWTEREELRAGISPGYAHNTFGVQTWTLRGGHWVLHTNNGLYPPDCRGPYTLRGHTLWADFNVAGCNGTLDATWSLEGDELRLRLRHAVRDDEIWWGTKPFRRIAG